VKIEWAIIIIVIFLVAPAIAYELIIMDYEEEYARERNGQVISYEYEDEGCSCVCTGY